MPMLRGHCRRHHTGIVLASLPTSHWLCPCCIGVVAVIALALCHLHCTGARVLLLLLCLRLCHRRAAIIAIAWTQCRCHGVRCWHCTDAVALASTPSHGRHCQRCTGAVTIILLASCWRFFQRCRHGWRHCCPCTGVITIALALTPLLGIIANVVHASLPSSPPLKTGLTPCLMWVRWLCVLPCYPRLAWLVDLVKGDLRVEVTLCSNVAFLAASLFLVILLRSPWHSHPPLP